jgi:hypothetical protein
MQSIETQFEKCTKGVWKVNGVKKYEIKKHSKTVNILFYIQYK